MTVHLDARAFRDLLADPAAPERLSAVTGTPLVIVEADGAPAARSLAGLDITLVPAVVLAVVRDPRCLPAAAFPAADLILTEDTAAGAPFVAPAGGIGTAIENISASLNDNPVAGAALALLLRSCAGLPVPAGAGRRVGGLLGPARRRGVPPLAGLPTRTGRPSPAPPGPRRAGRPVSCGSPCTARPGATRSTGGCATPWPVPWPSPPPTGGCGSCCAAPGLTSAPAATWTSSAPGLTRPPPTWSG